MVGDSDLFGIRNCFCFPAHTATYISYAGGETGDEFRLSPLDLC